MLFINNLYNANSQSAAANVKGISRKLVLLHVPTAAEQLLSQALQQRHGLDLRSCCLALIDHATFSRNFNNQILVTFIEPAYDTIAKEITYGINACPGTRLLYNIFE